MTIKPSQLSLVIAIILVLTSKTEAQRIAGERKAREIEQQIHKLINRERKARNQLTLDSRLVELARSHSRRMADAGFLSHDDPARGSLLARLDRAGFRWTMIAENISYARNPKSTAGQLAGNAVRGWMNSAGHRSNILNSRFTRTGIGAAVNLREEIYVTQIFGRN